MERSWYWRVALIVGVTLVSVWMLVPSYYYFRLPPDKRNTAVYRESVPRFPASPSSDMRLNLGLDLQGGVLLNLGVDVDRAVQAKVTRRADGIVEHLKEKNLPSQEVTTAAGGMRVDVKTSDPGAVQSSVLSTFGDMVAYKVDGGVQFAFKEAFLKDFREKSVEQAEKVIRNRIDALGVAEPDIKRKSNSQIQIQLPGKENPDDAKKLLGRTAQLEFKIADDGNPVLDAARQQFPACERNRRGSLPPKEGACWAAEAVQLPDGKVAEQTMLIFAPGMDKPPAPNAPTPIQTLIKEKLNPLIDPAKSVIMVGRDENRLAGIGFFRTYLLRARTEMTGANIADAGVGQDQQGVNKNAWVVTFKMSPEGAKLMGKLTEDNLKRRMAIVLDDVVESAPVIQSQIRDSGQITLGSTRDSEAQFKEANAIALVLRSGALPAPVTIASESTVGATLGPELVSKGTRAALIGLVAVLIFMVVYYRASGLIANVALVLNGLLVLAIMAMIQTTLTLPGIAGFVLTLGMAVDANVLINERIREEMRAGKVVKVAVQQGYDKVFWTIVDSHVTTLVAGFMLMEFGTGPIRGFAVTLIIGLLASLFTSIVVTRAIMEFTTRNDSARLSV